MSTKDIFDIFSKNDQITRMEALKCVPTSLISIFSTSLIGESISGRVSVDSVIHQNLIQYEKVKILNKMEFMTAIQTIEMIEKWLINNKTLYQDILRSKEIYLAFQAIEVDFSTDEQFDIAASFLQKLVELINVAHIEHQLEDNFLNILINLRPLFDESCNLAKLISMSKLYTSIGAKLIQKINFKPDRIFIILQRLLKYASYKELIELVFPFWRQLAKSIKSKQQADFLSYIEEFILMLTIHCKHSNVIRDGMIINNCDKNELVTFRSNVFILFEEISPLIDPQRSLMFYLNKIYEEGQSYEDVEVCLFIISCFISKVDQSENSLVPKLIQSILRVDEHSIEAISYMSIKIIKNLSKWLNYHQEYLLNVLNFLHNFLLKGGALASVAAESIAEICCDSKIPMQTYMNELFEFLSNLGNFSLPNKAELSFIKGISKVVYSFTNDQQIYHAMKILCDIQFSKISFYRDNQNSVVELLDQLAEIFFNIPTFNSRNNPAFCVFLEKWPAVSHMLDYYQENEAVMKMIIEVIQNAIEALEFSLYPILETIVIRILEIYSNKKYYFILQFMEKLISIFGNNKTFSQGLFTSFESFAIATFNGLNCESKLNVKLLIEFYKLSSTTLKVLPMIFLKSPLILTLIELALEGCKIKNKEVNKSAMNFIMNIIDCKCFHQDIEACVINALTKYSKQIIYILIVSSAFVYDNSQMTDVAEILFVIKTKSDEGFKILLTETMNLIIMRKITTGQIFNHNSSLNLIIGSLTKPKIGKCEMAIELNKFRNLFR